MLHTLTEGRIKLVHDKDPREYIIEKIGDLSELELKLNNILVVVYQRNRTATKTVGGIDISAAKSLNEDKWQGKVGLVVAMGPKAYQDDETTKFEGERVDVGDWVFFRVSDGWDCEMKGVLCRLFQSERHILGKIPHPDFVY